MRETLDGFTGGLQVGGRRITNLRYADDIVLTACSETKLQELENRLDRASSAQGLIINIDKSKIMRTKDGFCHIRIKGTQLEQLDTFPYLGSLITDDSEFAMKIQVRMAKKQGIA